MPFGRGFGFRGRSAGWPYVGLGRGGLPRCWAYGAYWDASYADPGWFGAYPYPSPSPWYWRPYGVNDPYYSQPYPGYPQTGGSWESPYGFPPSESPMMTPGGETEWLRRQAESIKEEIDQIKNRISELEKE